MSQDVVDEPFDKKSPTIRALVSEIVNTCKEIGSVNHLFRDHISAFAMSQSAANIADEPAKLADFAAAVSGGEMEEAQAAEAPKEGEAPAAEAAAPAAEEAKPADESKPAEEAKAEEKKDEKVRLLSSCRRP